MYLVIINPVGSVTSLDLRTLPIWRLETRTIAWPGSTMKALALGISYVNAGTSAFAAIVAINCLVEGDEVEPIARTGLPGGERGLMKERLREAVSALINANVPTKDVDDIKVAASSMVDCYHTIINQLWGYTPPLAAVGTDAKGELQGWKWALLRTERFSSWLSDGGTMAAPSAAVFEPPKIAPAAAAKPVDAMAADPLAPGSLDIGPPPDENGPKRRTKKKDATP